MNLCSRTPAISADVQLEHHDANNAWVIGWDANNTFHYQYRDLLASHMTRF